MKRIRTIFVVSGFAVVMLLVATIACLPKTTPSTVTTLDGKVRNARELTSLIYELTSQLTGTIETAAGRIQYEADSPEVQRAALIFKSEAVSALQHASFRNDPVLAVADVWLLTVQLQDWVASGEGRIAFGDQQQIMIDTTRRMELLMHEFLDVKNSTANAEAVQRVRDFAADNPIEGTIATRTTAVGPLAERLRKTKMGAFANVSGMAESLDDLSDRLAIYAESLPRQARWQAELAVFDLGLTEPRVLGALEDLNRLGTVSEQATELIDGLPSMIDERLDEVAPAVESAIASIDLYPLRSEVDAMISGHLDVALAAVTRERIAALEAVSREREIVLADVERMFGDVMDRSFERVEAQIDARMPHLIVVGLAVMVGPFVLGLVSGVLLRRRSPL
jgi:hypothetical protein